MCENVIFSVSEFSIFITSGILERNKIGNAQLLQHINDVMQTEAKEFHITESLPRQNPKPLLLGFKMYSQSAY